MIYLNYNEKTGEILSFHDDAISQTIPEPSVPISTKQWQEAIENGYNYYNAATSEMSFKDFRTLDEIRDDKLSILKGELDNYLAVYKLPNGINVVNDAQEQRNNLNSLLFSQMAIKSPQWAKSTAYKVNDVVYSDGVLLLCTTAGTSDSSNNPTPPTEFGVTVTDGTAEWAKLGFLVKTTDGRKYFTPQEIIEMSEMATAILHKALLKYDALKAKIEAATTVEELDTITW